MNRAEKRRNDRNKKKKRFLTDSEIEEIKKKATDDAIDTIFGMLFILPLSVLREQGWGKVRLQRFNDSLTDKLKEVESGELDLNKVIDDMRDNYGIIFKSEEE
ncbi:hypothetical protein [Peptostreptococcus faecalis]|uniref:hypothetical protein n=1 Tax=Peptostreptococcus faecalis TaxID=2045015 RepID=UPI000C7C9989|nr:hypothetical protein [Peptostreptococcus faecalis]